MNRKAVAVHTAEDAALECKALCSGPDCRAEIQIQKVWVEPWNLHFTGSLRDGGGVAANHPWGHLGHRVSCRHFLHMLFGL